MNTQPTVSTSYMFLKKGLEKCERESMIEFYFLGESRCCIDQNHTIHLKIKQKIYLIQNHTLFSSTKRACFSVCVCVCVRAVVNSSPVVPGCLTIVRVAGWKPSNSYLMWMSHSLSTSSLQNAWLSALACWVLQ